MSRIAEIEREIRELTAAIARAERNAALYPEYPSSFVTVRSLEKFKSRLVDQFQNEAAINRVNTCSYKIDYKDRFGPSIAGLTASLGLFQNIFTSAYHSMKNGIRKTAKVSAESSDTTCLEFSYSFPGSVGIMMTLKNDSNLFGDSMVDGAMKNTIRLLSAQTTDELDALTKVVGLPAVRLTHEWAEKNARSGFGAEIRWRPEESGGVEKRVQHAEVTNLSNILSLYTQKELLKVIGSLDSLSLSEQTFVMIVDEKRIKGTFDKAISQSKPASLPVTYWAQLTVATRVALREGNEEVTYHLEQLEPFDPRIKGPKPDEL